MADIDYAGGTRTPTMDFSPPDFGGGDQRIWPGYNEGSQQGPMIPNPPTTGNPPTSMANPWANYGTQLPTGSMEYLHGSPTPESLTTRNQGGNSMSNYWSGWDSGTTGSNPYGQTQWDLPQGLPGNGYGAYDGTGGTTGSKSMSNYWSDPYMQQYSDRTNDIISALMGGQPEYGAAMGQLNSAIDKSNQGYGDFKTIATRRLDQLKNPLFSTGGPINSPEAMKSSALLRSKFLEPLTQARDAGQRRVLERASARGFGQTSGLTEEMARGVDSDHERNMAQGYRDLMLQEIQANEGREQEAVNIGQLIAQLSHNPTAVGAAGQMGNIGSMRSRDLVQAANLSEGLGGAPMRNTMGQMDILNSLNNQGQSDSMTPLIQSLLQMTQQGGNAANNAGAQQGQFWNQLGQNLSGAYGNYQTGRGGGAANQNGWRNPNFDNSNWG